MISRTTVAAFTGLVIALAIASDLPARDARLVHADVRGRELRDNGSQAGDSVEVAAAVDRFHRALADGDSATVADLLAADAIILETGLVETRAEYLGGHLSSDIRFARAVPRVRSAIRVVVSGDVAWASSSSTARGRYRDRDVNSTGAELMILRRSAAGWRIAAIHWSSRAAR